MGLAKTAKANSPLALTAKTLDRNLDPVILTGASVPAFDGVPVDQVYVYALITDTWRQLPMQVDEVTASGAYTTTEDGRLDANDEIVFMAKDLGDQSPADPRSIPGFPRVAIFYEITVTDPLSPTHAAWAYLMYSSALTPTFSTDYVRWDAFHHRVHTANYQLGYATPQPWMDYLTLGNSTLNILDRAPKSRLCYGKLCLWTENNAPELPDDLIKDGPVRLIVRGGRLLAYAAMGRWTINIPTILGANNLRYTTDFNAFSSGSTLYNSVVPDGVTVDGITDTVPAAPLSPWWQLSTNHGTIVQASDTTAIGGTQTNYYRDNSQTDRFDTGDKKSYGEIGVHVASPNKSFTYSFALYFLSGRQPNVGATYQLYFEHPLTTSAMLRLLPLPEKVYVPLLIRQAARN